MRKTIKYLALLLFIMIVLSVAAIPAMADGFDFDTAIENFVEKSHNTKNLTIGQTDKPLASNWAQAGMANCYSSDEKVVTVESNGKVTAVGEGTAYVAIDTGSMYELYRYNVSSENAQNDKDGGMLSDFDDGFKRHLTFTKIFSSIVIAFIISVVILMIVLFIKCKKLDNAIRAISENPCQETAEAAVEKFSKINGFIRFFLANGGDSKGVHFSMWRDVFNHTLIPCRTVKAETKEELRRALVRLNTHSLYTVTKIQTPEEAKVATEAFGVGGENNVWHNLKTLPGCDLYRNVRINNGGTASEIDVVIVDENKGVFLLEIKSVGGIKLSDNIKVITYNLLKEDPSNQIYRHEYDFKTYFANYGIDAPIKNMLVFSWPNTEDRRLLDIKSFPNADYHIVTVEQLISLYRSLPTTAPIPEQTRKAIADKLKLCSKEWIVR